VVQAKDEQIKAKESEMTALERITPSRMLDEVEGLKRIYEEMVTQARNEADDKVAQLTKATGEEREQLEADLKASRLRIADLESHVVRSEDAADGLRSLLGDLNFQRAWTHLLERLPPKTRAYFRAARVEASSDRLILFFPYGFHHKMAAESVDVVEPLVKAWLGESIKLDLRLDEIPPKPAPTSLRQV